MNTLKEIIIILIISILFLIVLIILALTKKSSDYILVSLSLVLVIWRLIDILRFMIISKKIMKLYDCNHETLQHIVDVYKITNSKDLYKLMEKDYAYLKKI